MGYLLSSFSFRINAEIKNGFAVQFYGEPFIRHREAGGKFRGVPGKNWQTEENTQEDQKNYKFRLFQGLAYPSGGLGGPSNQDPPESDFIDTF